MSDLYLQLPSVVSGLWTRISRCRNGVWSFYYQDDVALTMTVLDIGHKEWTAQKKLYAV